MNKKRVVQTTLDPEVFTELKVKLAREGESVAGFLERAVKNHLGSAVETRRIERQHQKQGSEVLGGAP